MKKLIRQILLRLRNWFGVNQTSPSLEEVGRVRDELVGTFPAPKQPICFKAPKGFYGVVKCYPKLIPRFEYENQIYYLRVTKERCYVQQFQDQDGKEKLVSEHLTLSDVPILESLIKGLSKYFPVPPSGNFFIGEGTNYA